MSAAPPEDSPATEPGPEEHEPRPEDRDPRPQDREPGPADREPLPEDGDAPSSDPLDEAVARTEGLQPGRRLFHAANGLLFAGFFALLAGRPDIVRWVVGTLVAVLLVSDVLRLSIPRLNLLFFRLLRPLVSPRERSRIASSTWYVVGICLLVLLFPQHTWIPSVLVLALADPAASYAGRRWGRRRLAGGTLLGSTVFFVVCTAVLAGFCPLPVAAAVAVGVTAIEALPRMVVDDNVTVPLATALLMVVLGCA